VAVAAPQRQDLEPRSLEQRGGSVRIGRPELARGLAYGLAFALVLWGLLALVAFGVYSLV
jgi:hypothetical protein